MIFLDKFPCLTNSQIQTWCPTPNLLSKGRQTACKVDPAKLSNSDNGHVDVFVYN